jgi:hypothetical protein
MDIVALRTYTVTVKSAMRFWKSVADQARDCEAIQFAEKRYMWNKERFDQYSKILEDMNNGN